MYSTDYDLLTFSRVLQRELFLICLRMTACQDCYVIPVWY